MKRLLGVDTLFPFLAEKEPLLLDSEGVADALEELDRLMPEGTDAKAMLLNDTSILTRVQRGRKYLGEPPDVDPDSSYLEPFRPPGSSA